MIYLKKYAPNFVFGILFAVLMLLPDWIFDTVQPYISYNFDPFFILALFIFGCFLSMSGGVVFCIVLTLFLIMQLIQLNHIAYFGKPINPVDISRVLGEFSEISETGLASLKDVGFVTPLVLTCFGALFVYFFKFRKVLNFTWFAILVVVIALGVKPERAMRKTLKHFLPPESRYSIHNSLNSFSFFITHNNSAETIRQIIPPDFYKKYAVEPIKKETPRLIVFVMGESIASAQMAVLGGPKDTTPHLSELTADPNFHVFPALSGGVSTHTSLPIFFNVMREPGNLDPILDKTANLFYLAKQAGYTTHFLSAQDVKQTHEIGLNYIDDVITVENDRHNFAVNKDDNLLTLVQNRDFKTGKHFIVLNFRAMHSPYEKNYAHRNDEFSTFETTSSDRNVRVRNAYYNAMRYIDQLIFDLLNEFKKNDDGTGVFALTSDHGQLINYQGLFGHNLLLIQTAEVPFIVYGKRPTLAPYKVWTHYDIGKWLAELLGYSVINPNEEKDKYYIHGNNLYEEYDFLEIQRNNAGNFIPSRPQFIRNYVEDKINKGEAK